MAILLYGYGIYQAAGYLCCVLSKSASMFYAAHSFDDSEMKRFGPGEGFIT